MKITVKIKEVSVELSDVSDRAIHFSIKEIKEIISEVFENYKKLDI